MDVAPVSVWTIVGAPASAVFDLLADPSRHPVLDGSGSVRSLLRGPDRLYLGARFAMAMRITVPYVSVNRVVEFDEGRRLAWTNPGRALWRYELEPAGPASTRVTQTYDLSGSPLAGVLSRAGVVDRTAQAMRASLALLRDIGSPGG